MESGPDRNDGADGYLFFYAGRPAADVYHDRHDFSELRGGVYLGGEVTLARLDCHQKRENSPNFDFNAKAEVFINGRENGETDGSADGYDLGIHGEQEVDSGEREAEGTEPAAAGGVDKDGEWESVGAWTITAYCDCEICTGIYANGITASGTEATEGRTAASNVLPMGTEVLIEGHTYIIEDTGWTPYGETWIDLYFDNHDEALAWGVREMEVYVWQEISA